MRSGLAFLIIASAAFTANTARTFPDGAPWGAANPAAEQHCASCHFETEAVRGSRALVLEGLPPRPVPGAAYALEIVFEDRNMVVAGFQLIAVALGIDAGTFTSSDDNVETIGAAVRSTAPATGERRVSWQVVWHAPHKIPSTIIFYAAASAANDDGSPFGDTIHYRTYEITAN